MYDKSRKYLKDFLDGFNHMDEAAYTLGVPSATLYAILNGNRSMGELTIQRIMAAFPDMDEKKLRSIKNYKGKKV